MKPRSSRLLSGLIAAMMLTAASSCSSKKQTVLPYFTDAQVEMSVPVGTFGIKIVPDDELLINVSAADPAAVEAYTVPYQHPRIKDFNTPSEVRLESAVATRRANGLTYMTYTVSSDGFITFPVLGKINVEGMTM